MKDYINLAIRVNIAIILAVQIVAALVIPFVVVTLSSTGIGSENENTGIWIGILTSALIVFLAAKWVFKLTYGNMKKAGKKITLNNSIMYSTILFVIANIGISFLQETQNYVSIAFSTVIALIAFYLAGKKVDSKQEKSTSADASV